MRCDEEAKRGMTDLEAALISLRTWVEREGFRGYDPYDTLNAALPFRALGKWGPVLAIQLQKRNPLNLRPVLGIRKDFNPKGMGLFLHAYSDLYGRDGSEEAVATARELFRWLVENASTGYSGLGWGYNFDWASPVKYLQAFTPSVVVTGFVAKGIFRYWETTGDARALEVARSACDFILEDLPVSETPQGLCISYTPITRDCCYNASLLGAELLARLHSVTGEERLLETAVGAVEFVLARQHEDGHWNYSIDLESGRERPQVDFHQGFVLDSLDAFVRYTGRRDPQILEAIRRGAAFYRREQFTDDGRARWRLPGDWPADIHHQAQGILTFSRLAGLDAEYGEFARRIARWTVRHMQDEDGYFYYRMGRLLKNRIPYIRWGQAWMMLALTHVHANDGPVTGSYRADRDQAEES